jgi:hypothetical protein
VISTGEKPLGREHETKRKVITIVGSDHRFANPYPLARIDEPLLNPVQITREEIDILLIVNLRTTTSKFICAAGDSLGSLIVSPPQPMPRAAKL